MLVVKDGRQIQVCSGCEQEFDETNTDPIARNGYVSPDSSEYIDWSVGGIPGKKNVAKDVCKFCYRTDWEKVHPGIPCPV